MQVFGGVFLAQGPYDINSPPNDDYELTRVDVKVVNDKFVITPSP